MWLKEYRDYHPDKPLKKYRVEPSRGIIGCEMDELNGWGTPYIHKEPHEHGRDSHHGSHDKENQ